MSEYWFRKRRFGFGWSPQGPQGWSCLIAFLAAAGIAHLLLGPGIGAIITLIVFMPLLLVAVIRHGEPLRRKR